MQHYFVVRDKVNTVRSAVKSVVIDTKAPEVVIVEPTPGEIVYGRSAYVTVDVNETVDTLDYSVDGGRWYRLCSDCDFYNRRRSFRDGTHWLEVRCTDYAGNIGYASVPFTVEG